MTDERCIKIDIGAEVKSYFDVSSASHGGTPDFAIVMGGPAVGKTTLRKQKFSKAYVLVVAADIFIRLSKGLSLDFPEDLEEPMEIFGKMIAGRAVAERRNIVTELIGADYDATVELKEDSRSRCDEAKPVFFGHYWMTGSPQMLSATAACVDYSAARDGPLVAYRWDGEPVLNNDNFRSVG
jgi:hypothetical protein